MIFFCSLELIEHIGLDGMSLLWMNYDEINGHIEFFVPLTLFEKVRFMVVRPLLFYFTFKRKVQFWRMNMIKLFLKL